MRLFVTFSDNSNILRVGWCLSTRAWHSLLSSIIVNETWFWCGYHPTKRGGIDILISAAAVVGWPQREVLMHIIDTLWPHGSPCILYSVLSSGQNSSRYSGHMGAIPRLFYLRRKLHQILLLYSDSVFITLTLSPCPINDSVFRDTSHIL